MKLRKLDQSEHGSTRPLWEEVFPDDTKAFLDYYYYIKTRDNEIYVVEEDDQVCSMLQLNPYQIVIEGREFLSAYIIAVATREKYRGRGYMGALLRTSLENMYKKKIPFTFLMPAAEAIYTPYDFRFVYEQNIGVAGPEGHRGADRDPFLTECTFSDAALWEAEEISGFVRDHFTSEWQVYAVRDTAYYQTMIMEQQSEKGGLRLIRFEGSLKGIYAYAAEEELEIREPLYLPEYESAFYRSVTELCGDRAKTAVRIYACPEQSSVEKKPVIMARIVCLEEFLKALTVPSGMKVDCSFAVIDPLIRQNSRVWRVTSGTDETELHVRDTEDSEGVLPVAALTELLFGRVTADELAGQDEVIMTAGLARELDKITKLANVFLNEVV